MLRLFTLLLASGYAYAQQTETERVAAIIGANSAGVVLNLDFASDPSSSVGGTINWQYQAFDTRDSTADQALHRGIARFTGSSTSYCDLSLSTGPQSCGRTLSQFGGTGYGHGLTPPRPGVSYEMVVKFDAISNWAKPFDFGTGPGIDEMTWTWDGDSDGIGRFLIEQYVNASLINVDFDKAAMEFFRPNLNEWYHLTQVQVPAENGAATWYLYINGNKLPLAGALTAGAALVPLQSANYPRRTARSAQYLARSQWAADPYMQMTLDAVRVYDYALNDGEISSLATVYGLNNNRYVPLTQNTDPFPESAERTKWTLPSIGFQPVYSLDFATNPTSTVGGSLNWEWLAEDPSDTTEERAKHRGLAKFNGGATNFIDLMQSTGPQSAGKVIPTLFTNSPGQGAAHGWTIEMVVKPLAIQSWAKYYCLGSGPYYDAIYTGWISGDNLWEAASYNNIRDQLRPFNPGQLTFYRAPTLNKWTHITWVLKPQNPGNHPLSSYAATWELYVDGQLVSRSSTSTNYPLPLVRRQAYLALSNWAADAPARMVVDAFRVWDRALNADQVEDLSNAYGISPVDGGDWAWQQAMSRNSFRAPVYELDFQTNPTQNTGAGPISWTWSEQDTSDATVVAGQHTGLAIFNGTADSWIDMATTTGPNRATDTSRVIPQVVGGLTTPGGSNAPGWSYEIVFKATGWRGWSKLFAISNGADRDETIMGFDGDNNEGNNNLVVQNYIEDAASPYAYAATEIVKPIVMGRWYHIILTMKPGSVEGSGNWQVFVNGQLQNWADRILPGHTFTEIQGASYPRGVPRPNAYLARSTWNDPTSQIIIDAFRVYDYAVTQAHATAFAQAYGTQVNVPVPTSADNVNFPDSAEKNNWQAAGLPVGPIFNGVFSQNPASYVGGRTDYQYLEFDPTDNSDAQQRHRGLLVFNGSDPSFVDLNAVTGPKSVGLVMPIIGGHGAGSQRLGMTIELVVKLTAIETWAKLIQMGSGPDLDSFIIGWNNDRYNTIEVHNFNRIRPGLQRVGAVDLMSQPPLNQWLFITLVMELTNENTYTGNWVAYESGNVIATKTSTDATNPANFPLPIYRPYNYIAKSQWTDPTATMLLDMYRVYDYAFTEAQVRASVEQYGMYGRTLPPSPITNVSLEWDATDESRAAAAAVSRAPVFNAYFPVNPTTRVSPQGLAYTWLPSDPTDSANDQLKHRGIVQLTGDSNCYVDVTTNAGPNSAGVVLPIIGGPGSGTGDRAGWSFELVFKVQVMTSWVKLFNFGNGPEVNNIILGVDGTDSSTMSFEMFDRTRTMWPHGFAEVFQPELNKWYHLVVEVAPTANQTTGAGVWYFYVNGRKLAYSDALWPGTSFTPIQGASYPVAIYRRNSAIGKSNWNDPTFRGLLDAFRIYDYRLSQTEVQALAAAYDLNNGAVTLPTPAENNPNVNPSNQPEVGAWNHDGIPAPVFNAPFPVDPRSAIGGAPSSYNYNWMADDPEDSAADRAAHKGLIKLNGETNQYIDLARATGSQSVGLVLPTLFTNNDNLGAVRGWTVEIECKVHREEAWSKLLNFATGGYDWMDSWGLTWNGDQPNQWAIQNYLNLNPINGQPAELGFANFLRPIQLNKWYHIAIVMQPIGPSDRFAARWKIYVDGTLVHSGDYNMPLPVVRENSFIGASQWGSQDRKSQMTVDAVRVYDRGLTTAQVASLARMYGHSPQTSAIPEGTLPPVLPALDPMSNGGGPVPGADGTPGGGGSTSSSSSKLSGGAIAGIVIGAVVGAAILCVILFCVCAGGNRFGSSSKSSTSDPDQIKGTGGYGQMEASRAGADDEIEMGETSETA